MGNGSCGMRKRSRSRSPSPSNQSYHRKSTNKNLISKPTPYKELSNQYHLFEKRWTTIREFEKPTKIAIEGLKKVLERNTLNINQTKKKLIRNCPKDSLNGNVFWVNQNYVFYNRKIYINEKSTTENSENDVIYKNLLEFK